MGTVDGRLTAALAEDGIAYAVVRVHPFVRMERVARRFDVVARFPFINSIGIRCDKKQAGLLAEMREVASATVQSRVRVFKEPSEDVPEIAEAFGVRGATGRGVTLCVLDTGVSPHTDLSVPKDRIKGFKDFVGGREFPYDDNGHGTFVTGVAAGSGLLSAGKVRGVAPEADVVALKAISASGETGAFTILEAMQWLFENAARLNVKVACMSFGADPLPSADPLKLGAEMISRRGVTVVCASGNSGVGGLKSPGVSSEVITVGAVDEDLKVAPFTSSGIYQGVYRPDVFAPGVSVRGVEAGGTYSVMSGTSVSAPYVAGACCLLYERCPRLSPGEVKRLILSASRSVDGYRVFSLD